MKRLGILAIVCAKRSDVEMRICNGDVTISIGSGERCECVTVRWDDDKSIKSVVDSLNFGNYREGQREQHKIVSGD